MSDIASRRSEYESAGLDVADVDRDPVVQWQRWYDEAVAAGVTEPNAMAVSTLGEDGVPDVRIVLVRGADESGFAFYTNLASAKARQVVAHASAGAAFGWLELHRQVRIRGRVERVSDAEADAYFASRARESQIGAWASRQSETLESMDALRARVAEVEARFADKPVPRPPYWTGRRVRPSSIEFWREGAFRLHERRRFERAGDRWTMRRLFP